MNSNNVNFGGSIIFKHARNWSKAMQDAAKSNPKIQELASGTKDVILSSSRRIAKDAPYPSRHHIGDPLYRITISTKDSNVNFIQRIKSFFKPNKVTLSRNHHSEYSTIQWLKAFNREI